MGIMQGTNISQLLYANYITIYQCALTYTAVYVMMSIALCSYAVTTRFPSPVHGRMCKHVEVELLSGLTILARVLWQKTLPGTWYLVTITL